MAHVEISHLHTFVTVADLGSITHAAGRLACVQSNITTRVRQLEEQLGERLFVRSRRGVALTEAGTRLYPKARDILDRVDALHVAKSETGVSGTFRLGVVETVASLELPGILASLRSGYPGLLVEMVTGTTQDLLRSIHDLKLDAAIVSGPVGDRLITGLSVRTDRLLLVSSAADDMPAIRRNRPAPPLYVYKAGCAFRAALEGWLRLQNATPAAVNELGTLDGILAHVAAGNGCTALPGNIVASHRLRSELRTSPIPGSFGKIQTSIAYLKDGAASPRLKAFNEVAMKHLGIVCDPADC